MSYIALIVTAKLCRSQLCVCLFGRCDFESYGLCGLEQQQNDELDWRLIQSDQRVDNVPSGDHTLGTSQGQYA